MANQTNIEKLKFSGSYIEKLETAFEFLKLAVGLINPFKDGVFLEIPRKEK